MENWASFTSKTDYSDSALFLSPRRHITSLTRKIFFYDEQSSNSALTILHVDVVEFHPAILGKSSRYVCSSTRIVRPLKVHPALKFSSLPILKLLSKKKKLKTESQTQQSSQPEWWVPVRYTVAWMEATVVECITVPNYLSLPGTGFYISNHCHVTSSRERNIIAQFHWQWVWPYDFFWPMEQKRNDMCNLWRGVLRTLECS